MPNWLMKAAIQGFLSQLPRYEELNYLCQRYVTRGMVLDEKFFEKKLNDCRQFLESYFKFSEEAKQNLIALELGPGWHPIIPMGFYFCGAEKIYTFDIINHLRKTSTAETLKLFSQYAEDGRLKNFLPRLDISRLDQLKKIAQYGELIEPIELLANFNIKVLIEDVRQSDLPDSTIDLFFSNAVLQHIPEQILEGIFIKFHSLGHKSSVMINNVNLYDHYNLSDKTISTFNFYRYSDQVWSIFNNKLAYQNRLRISDYNKIHEKTGWKIVEENRVYGSLEELNKINIDKKFRKYTNEDLLVNKAYIVAIRKTIGS